MSGQKDFKYLGWFDTAKLDPAIGTPPENVPLHEPANSFFSNMGRVEVLGQLPWILVALGISKGHADVFARLSGKNIDEVVKSAVGTGGWSEHIVTPARELAAQAANSRDPSVRKAYQALVAAIVVASYGSIEHLMVDLRDTVLGLRPYLTKQIKKKPQLRNLKSLRHSYEAMFPEDSSGSPHNLSKEFASHYSVLLVLEAVRNLFAHRSGIVDPKFLKLVETSSALRNRKVGEELFVDFHIARNLASVTRDFGAYLIRFVDWWLNTHAAETDRSRSSSR